MSDMTYTGSDDYFWEQWEKMTPQEQSRWALQRVIIGYVQKEQDKERPLKLNRAIGKALCDLQDELSASVPVLETPPPSTICSDDVYNCPACGTAPVEPVPQKRCDNRYMSISGATVRCIGVEGHDDPHVYRLGDRDAEVEPVPAPPVGTQE